MSKKKKIKNTLYMLSARESTFINNLSSVEDFVKTSKYLLEKACF